MMYLEAQACRMHLITNITKVFNSIMVDNEGRYKMVAILPLEN